MTGRDRRYRVYLYGAGEEYNRFTQVLGRYSDKIRVEAVLTTEVMPFSHIDYYPCITVDEADFEIVDYVIIVVERAWKEIFQTLISRGFPSNRIIRSKGFFNPNFDFDEYIDLISNNVTIISNYCLGGIICSDLGLPCLSPTKNMFCRSDHFIEFVNNLEYYLNFNIEEYSPDSTNYEYEFASYAPMGIINNSIIWHFNHATSSREGVDRWNQYRKKVNFDNVAILMECHSEEDAYKLNELSYSKKLGMYYKPLDLPNVIYCPLWNEPAIQIRYGWNWPTFANRFFTNKDGYISPVNWIRFLTGRDGYIRYHFQK